MKWTHPECAPFKVGTTRVSNPVCSPDFRASASVLFKESAFASGVLQDINAFHRYTLHSGPPSRTRAAQSRTHFPGWARRFHIRHTPPPTRPLRPVNPNNARDLCITAAAGTELAVASSWGTINSTGCSPVPPFPPRQEFTTRGPPSSTQRRIVRLSPIANDPRLQPPVGVWAVSQSQWGWSSSQTS